jgi:FtsH-binding integral membrane protein
MIWMRFLGSRGPARRKLMLIQAVFLAVLLVATFALHISGTMLVELRIARFVLFAALLVGVSWFSRRRDKRSAMPGHDRPDH